MPNRTKLGFGSGIELALLVALGIAYVSPRGLQPQTASGSAYIPGTSIARRGADGVDVVMWDGGSLLLVEDYITRVGLEYDPVLQSYRELDAPDPAEGYALSMLPEGLSVDGDYLLFAGDDGDGFVDLHTGDVTRLSVPRTVQASPLMAFDPTVRLASVVISRSGEVNRLGAGELSLFDMTGAAAVTITGSAVVMDFSPAWASGGSKLVFLCGPAGALRSDPGIYGSELQELPVDLMVHDLDS